MSNNLKISIVTPSYNQSYYLEQTITSVLNQNYQNLEYIIIDGGSTDGSVEIIKNYQKSLTHWLSEQDNGQTHALNKGFRYAQGDIFGWINSDDYYTENALQTVANCFYQNEIDILIGNTLIIQNGKILQKVIPQNVNFNSLLRYWKSFSIPCQPAIFFSKKIWDEFGPLDESLHYAMDYDFWLKISKKYKFYILDQDLAFYRFHEESKSCSGEGFKKFIPEWNALSLFYAHKYLNKINLFLYYKDFFDIHASDLTPFTRFIKSVQSTIRNKVVQLPQK